MKTAVIVLAAGTSRRYGDADKLLAVYRGKPLAAHVADMLKPLSFSARIAVISNPLLRGVFSGFDIVGLPNGLGGQSASIRAGVARARKGEPDKIVIVLADMPEITSSLLQRIVDAATPGQPAAATNGGNAMPPACFPASYFAQLETLSGDAGARDILKVLPRSALVPVPPAMLHDVDRVEDLRQNPGK